jgi:transposase-like protein
MSELATVDTAEQENPACPSCGHEHTIYLGTFPEVREDAYGCRLCGREFNLIPDEGDQQ